MLVTGLHGRKRMIKGLRQDSDKVEWSYQLYVGFSTKVSSLDVQGICESLQPYMKEGLVDSDLRLSLWNSVSRPLRAIYPRSHPPGSQLESKD